jgi:hydroxymethylpyrimidine/phosphomethylpyrimidine kinase
MVRDQLQAVFEELPPGAVKTGMLYSESIIRAVATFLRLRALPIIVDPVMVSSSGARLLAPKAIESLCCRLLPTAALITPNLPEAEALLATRLRSVEDLRGAAKELHRRFGSAVLLKGGHLRGLNEAIDIFRDKTQELLLSAPFVRGVHTHGTGCTYSAAITAYLAKGHSLAESVILGKEFITQAIAQSRAADGHSVLNYLWNRK